MGGAHEGMLLLVLRLEVARIRTHLVPRTPVGTVTQVMLHAVGGGHAVGVGVPRPRHVPPLPRVGEARVHGHPLAVHGGAVGTRRAM